MMIMIMIMIMIIIIKVKDDHQKKKILNINNIQIHKNFIQIINFKYFYFINYNISLLYKSLIIKKKTFIKNKV